MRVLSILLLVLLGQCVCASDIGHSLSNNLVNELFTTLPGTWDGRAVETPVGPVDYAMNFHQCNEDAVAGVANTGASLHYWRFWKSDGDLRLTFLSTFRDNQDTTQLVPNKFEEKTIWFFAPELDLLTLSITLADQHIDLRVFHHQQPHVYIRLTRADKPMSESERAESLAKSCKILTQH